MQYKMAAEGRAAPTGTPGPDVCLPARSPVPVTFAVHAHLEALEQPAVLAPVALLAGHDAVLVPAASVDPLVADAPFEEPLAALAGDDPIVQPRGPVPADQAGSLIHPLICKARGKALRRSLEVLSGQSD